MKYFSTFTGIGGFELGIEYAYEILHGRTELKKGSKTLRNRHDIARKAKRNSVPVCVGYSEIDPYATKIYQKHYPEHENYGDITKINPKKLPDFDLLVGGFPCQAFSIAGHRKGFSDTRGTLFFEIARIIKCKRPSYLLLENVKGLLSHDNGRTFAVIITALDELGYDLQWQVLNSKNHGVPQNRERIFIVGHLRGTSRPEVFPFAGDAEEDGLRIKRIAHMRGFRRYNQTYAKDGIVEAMDTSGGGGHQPCVIDHGVVKKRKGVNTIDSNYFKGADNHGQRTMIYQRARGRNHGGMKSIAPTLTGSRYEQNNLIGGIRRLTPVECERLQGFPHNWTEGVSDSQRYKCLGNAVTVNVIRDIMIRFLK